jgi:putative hydrolase of the HAD superfamily
MHYKHIFFDLDHTLWDFDKNSYEAMGESFDNLKIGDFLGVDYASFDSVYKKINQKYWERFRNGFVSREDLRWKRMQSTFLEFKKYDDDLSKKLGESYLEILPSKTHLFAGAIEVLSYCRDKEYELHLITNGFEATQQKKIKQSGIDHFFDIMISSEVAMAPKPKPQIFEYAMQKTNASADKSLMIGDHFDVDILGAKGVGMDQVYFNPKKRVNNSGATYEIEALSELLEIL